jgi:hypothetical protein
MVMLADERSSEPDPEIQIVEPRGSWLLACCPKLQSRARSPSLSPPMATDVDSQQGGRELSSGKDPAGPEDLLLLPHTVSALAFSEESLEEGPKVTMISSSDSCNNRFIFSFGVWEGRLFSASFPYFLLGCLIEIPLEGSSLSCSFSVCF